MNGNEIADKISLLASKNAPEGFAAMNVLLAESSVSDGVYAHFDELAKLLASTGSFVRIRAFALIAANAARDKENRIDEILPLLLAQITDPKPITARQCIQKLPSIAEAKPELAPQIKLALQRADVSFYADSMLPLVLADISLALEKMG